MLVEYFNVAYNSEPADSFLRRGVAVRRENKPNVRLPRTSNRNRELVSEAVNLINENLPEEHRIEISERLLPPDSISREYSREFQESENEIALVFTSSDEFFPTGSTEVDPENIESIMNLGNRVMTQETATRRIANCERLNRFAGSSRNCSTPEWARLPLPDILYPVDKAALGVLYEVLETGDRVEDFESEIDMWLESKECFELIEAGAPSME